jgi:Fe2+ transport system protein FeoA
MTSPSAVLSGLAVGQRGRVVGFDLPPEQRQRLLEMGLTTGIEFQVVRFAPLGDPIELRVRGYHLSLRKNEAAGVRVELIGETSK